MSASHNDCLSCLLYFIDGNQLLQWCEANNPACVGYVAGVSDELNVNRTLMQNVPSCTSEGATTEQLADMVVKYLASIPRSDTIRRLRSWAT